MGPGVVHRALAASPSEGRGAVMSQSGFYRRLIQYADTGNSAMKQLDIVYRHRSVEHTGY